MVPGRRGRSTSTRKTPTAAPAAASASTSPSASPASAGTGTRAASHAVSRQAGQYCREAVRLLVRREGAVSGVWRGEWVLGGGVVR